MNNFLPPGTPVQHRNNKTIGIVIKHRMDAYCRHHVYVMKIRDDRKSTGWRYSTWKCAYCVPVKKEDIPMDALPKAFGTKWADPEANPFESGLSFSPDFWRSDIGRKNESRENWEG